MHIPRVTEILRPYTHFENVPVATLQRAAARGTSVHAICAGIARGAWVPEAMVQEEYAGYVKSFKLWAEAQIKKFVIIEERYFEEDLGFSGQLDFVAVGSDDKLYLVDIKTSSKPQKTYSVQLAAYKHLLTCKKVAIEGAMLVYLSKNGEFPEVELYDSLAQELGVFLSALECWYYFNSKGKKYDKQLACNIADADATSGEL